MKNIHLKPLLQEFLSSQEALLEKNIQNFDFEKFNKNFDFYTKSSAVFSSNIEGNTLDLNSFMNQKILKNTQKTKEVQEIEDLVTAYNFAQANTLNEKNFLKTHKLSAKTFLTSGLCGKYREQKVGVFGTEGLIYMAIEPEKVKKEMKDFFSFIQKLEKQELTILETFFYASFLHLRFVHIHPFMDGNGRMARLLEKWFLSQKLGKKYWNIPSEHFYFKNRKKYYKSTNLGVNFYELDYSKSKNFLKLLIQALEN